MPVAFTHITPLALGALLLLPVTAMPCDAPVPLNRVRSTAALTLCQQADLLAGSERQSDLMRGLQLAEEAVAADPCDARAHLAVFCNLGKQVQSDPLGLRQIGLINRLKREIDTAFALAPGDADILAAKGAMLLALPRLLGGDARQGEVLVREALAREPGNVQARRYLIEALGPAAIHDDATGEHGEHQREGHHPASCCVVP